MTGVRCGCIALIATGAFFVLLRLIGDDWDALIRVLGGVYMRVLLYGVCVCVYVVIISLPCPAGNPIHPLYLLRKVRRTNFILDSGNS